jgi:hypothetical protein
MKQLLKKILSYFPSKLPVGITEFEAFSSEIIELAGKYADIDSLKFAIASMIIHADARFGALPKNYFVVRLRKVAANQVASQVFTDIKNKQQEAQKAAQNLVEATTPPLVASNETQNT